MALAVRLLGLAAVVVFFSGCAGEGPLSKEPSKTVRATVQTQPGGPVEEVEMGVHEAPLDLPLVSVAEAGLEDDDLVLGVVLDGQATAYPIRYLALSEVINGTAGKTAVAPTW